jgi:ribosomal protein S3AE
MIVAKKKAFEVEIPIIRQTMQVLAVNQDALIGRVIKIDLTRIMKGKNLDAALVIRKENDKLVGEFLYIKLLPTFIRRMIRKSISYVEDSFEAKGKEGTIILKPFLITRKRVHNSVRRALRNRAKETILEIAKDKSNNEIFESILDGSMQKEVAVNLKKIYPLAFSEIRVAKLKRQN